MTYEEPIEQLFGPEFIPLPACSHLYPTLLKYRGSFSLHVPSPPHKHFLIMSPSSSPREDLLFLRMICLEQAELIEPPGAPGHWGEALSSWLCFHLGAISKVAEDSLLALCKGTLPGARKRAMRHSRQMPSPSYSRFNPRLIRYQAMVTRCRPGLEKGHVLIRRCHSSWHRR